ncbi:hydantoinase B/oxoprolinase family protein [Alphaproteobacteria bacterium]|nr:hydantoinase B/oxoprolinase family protein [Alphaproteobacteria bacterium]
MQSNKRATSKIDPITLQVIGGALHTSAREMGHVLYRMSFSSIIRESEDLGAGLFDANFQTLSESDSTPLHIGSIPGYLRGMQETLQDGEWYDGDVVIHNHPYHGASHSPDLAIAIPVFWEGKLVGFSANTAHHIDIGAATPGLIIDIGDVYAEGMLFAGIKLYRKNERNEGLWQFIESNSRTSKMLKDDIEAQVASAQLGAERMKDLIKQYGLKTFQSACSELLNYTERMLRQQIKAIPNGTYKAEGWCDDDGRNRDKKLPIKVAVKVKGDNITVDLTGSADQVPTAYNVPFEGSTKVAVYCAFRSLLLDQAETEVYIPSNEGSFRPIEVIAPEGSIFNPKFPAAAEARFTQCNRVIDCIYRALAPVMPKKVTAGNSASLSFISYAGLKPSGDYWVFLEVNEGSYGARATKDGPDSIDNLMCNTRNNPLEDLGMHLPMVCERYELRDDVMPGAGRQRGGIGVVKAQRVLTDGIITHECDRHTDIPWGAFGGKEGAVGMVHRYNTQNSKDITNMPAKFSGIDIKADDVIAFYGPCGGGYGNPLERPAEQVVEDVLDDFCTIEHAKKVYGVIMSKSLKLDKEKTNNLRKKMKNKNQQN